MRPDSVVVLTPLFDHDLCFLQRIEDLSVQQLVTQLAFERPAVAVLPGAPPRDVERRGPHATDPPAQLFSILILPAVSGHLGKRLVVPQTLLG